MPENFIPITVPDLFTPGRYGLLTAVNWVTPPDANHWRGGIVYDADCTEVAVTIMECITGAAASKTDTWSTLRRAARAFTCYDKVSCTPVGDWWDDAVARSLRALANSGPTQVEKTFWSGRSTTVGGGAVRIWPNLVDDGPIYTDATNRVLFQPDMVVVSGGLGLDVADALTALEKAFGDCYDGEGVVHVPYGLANRMAEAHLLFPDGSNIMRTANGNRVVFGRGYDPTIGINNSTISNGTSWMFMTSPIFGIRGAPRTFTREQSLDRSVNTLSMIAEQTYVFAWHCCLAGVLVSA